MRVDRVRTSRPNGPASVIGWRLRRAVNEEHLRRLEGEPAHDLAGSRTGACASNGRDGAVSGRNDAP